MSSRVMSHVVASDVAKNDVGSRVWATWRPVRSDVAKKDVIKDEVGRRVWTTWRP